MSANPPCQKRIIEALRFSEKTPDTLANELFVDRKSIKLHLSVLVKLGAIHRRFFHNKRTNKPDYFYSTVRFHLRQYGASNNSGLQELVSAWDCVDMKKVKE